MRRASAALALFLLATPWAGCTAPLREVMLAIGTDTDCASVDAVTIVLARGTPNHVVNTLNYVREGCPVSPAYHGLTAIRLSDWADTIHLGLVDQQRDDDRLYVEIQARRHGSVTGIARGATDFQDSRVPLLAVQLSQYCLGATMSCPATQTCVPDEANQPTCINAYTAPSSLRRATASITSEVPAGDGP